MNDLFQHKISQLELEQFTCFERVSFDFSSGINVLIGENGTGKTHVLKVLYTLLKNKLEQNYQHASPITRVAFREYFKCLPEALIRNNDQASTTARLTLSCAGHKNEYHLGRLEDGEGYKLMDNIEPYLTNVPKKNSLYLPPQEMLTWHKGFTYQYNRRENELDKIFYDLADALSGALLKNGALEEAQALVTNLEEVIGAKVIKREDERFVFVFNKKNNKEIEAPLVATGINKLGQLIYLILNGSLSKDTILFWDEPETNLNPRYITTIATFIQALAKAGVQIFVATHNYLLVQQLSLVAEYRTREQAIPPMQFFALYHTDNGTAVEAGDTIAAIEHDAILDEYASHYDRESHLFQKSIKKG